MIQHTRRVTALLAVLVLLAAHARAQDSPAAIDLITKAAQNYAEGYGRPLGNMFSAVFNSGQYHTADAGSFHVYVSLQSTAAITPAAEKTFSPDFSLTTGSDTSLPVELRNKTVHIHKTDIPTILGGRMDNTYLFDTVINGKAYHVGPVLPGIGQDFVPLVVPHVEIGTFMGTELILRGLPPVETNSSIGKISFYGIGLRHSLTGQIPVLPVDVSVMGMYQHLSAGDVVSMDAYNLAALASVNLPVLTLYAGLQVEHAELRVHYDLSQAGLPHQSVDVNFQSTNNVRTTIGVTIKLLILYINGQVTLAPVNTIGLGVGIRIPPSIF